MSEAADYAAADPGALHPGAILRQGREARGLSIDEVAQALKLTPRQVAAIESEEFDLLPGNTFARGFVRNYARLFQIDAAPLLAALELRLSRGEVDLSPPSNAAGTMPAGSGARGVPRVLLLLLAAVVVVLVGGVLFDRLRPDALGHWRLGGLSPAVKEAAVPAPQDAPGAEKIELPPLAPQPLPAAVLPAAPAVVDPAPPAPPAAGPASAAAPAADARDAGVRHLRFAFDKDSWVEVKDGAGKLLVSQLNKTGATLAVDGKPPFAVVIGNAAAVQLTYDDRIVDLKPHTGVTVARLRLD